MQECCNKNVLTNALGLSLKLCEGFVHIHERALQTSFHGLIFQNKVIVQCCVTDSFFAFVGYQECQCKETLLVKEL